MVKEHLFNLLENVEAVIGTGLLGTLGISPANLRFNSPGSHTALHRGSFGIAAKIHFDPGATAPLLKSYAADAKRAASYLNGKTGVVTGANGKEVACRWEVNPILAVGLANWRGERRTFELTPFVGGIDLHQLVKGGDTKRVLATRGLCAGITTELRQELQSKRIHILAANVRFLPDDQRLVITKVWGKF